MKLDITESFRSPEEGINAGDSGSENAEEALAGQEPEDAATVQVYEILKVTEVQCIMITASLATTSPRAPSTPKAVEWPSPKRPRSSEYERVHHVEPGERLVPADRQVHDLTNEVLHIYMELVTPASEKCVIELVPKGISKTSQVFSRLIQATNTGQGTGYTDDYLQ
ncbi:hypothetical protein QAD02_007838 [Eretmocerus hayati]|uniref:Uncharacterized protein n=1 Tax=Eretmocerus hayati TaxID=131215 RepID=A0ACC2N660_9HYME|nr:hypothetical protein QAD02_007838 [Eretmocerus hayati]